MDEYEIEEQVKAHKLNDKEKKHIIRRKNKLHRANKKRCEKRREIFNSKRTTKKKG